MGAVRAGRLLNRGAPEPITSARIIGRMTRGLASESPAAVHDADWHRTTRTVVTLSWFSLVWMTVEGGVGLAAGIAAGSIALIGWALSSAVEGMASVIVIWRFTGSRTTSETAERRAQRAVAVSFWLLAPYVAVEAVHKLVAGDHPEPSILGIVLTTVSLILMPALGTAKRRLGRRVDSDATAGEGMQNLLCAYLAGAVLLGLVLNSSIGWWWADPVIALIVAAVAMHEGAESWRGDGCD
jgi:divalent metal cation (Fe/Co/Zn/Cd) transporter